MYHCNVHFYLAGHQRKVFEIIKGMSPLAHFTHVFSESIRPDPELAAKADVILADLQDVDVLEAVPKLLSAKGSEAELILLADRDQILLLTDKLPEIKDIWTMPMSDEEIRFRFLRWQQTCKMSKDFWQTSHFFESTINNVPNLIWYKDKKGIHTKVNDSFCKTVNKTKEQVEGRGHAYIWDVDHDDPACIESELEVMNTKKTCISEETVKSGDGTRLLTTYKSPLYDIDGSVMGTVGVAIDVTQERAYEQEIVQKNHTLETIFTTMDCGVIDEDKEMLRSSIRELKKEGDSVSVEYRVRHKDGKLLHIMGNVKLLKEKGESFYQRFLLDCTAQKLQEEKKERRHMELVQALSTDYNIVCFYELDTDVGSSLRIDEGIRHIYGDIFTEAMSYRDSMEQYIQEFVYEEDRELMRQSFSQENVKKELSEKKSYYVNYRAIRGGEMRYFQLKIVRAGVWGEGHGIVLGLRSVDEEIRNEMEKKNLLQDALLQANRASKAKSVFLSNMSHDIRTPMNAIVGFTALAITHIDRPDQVEEYLKKIMTSGNHLLSLINDVLDMSRIESGKMHLDEKPCSLPDILHGLRSIVQSDIHAKQLELYIDTVDVLDEDIYCDKLRLNQVLLNLLSNAIKYTTAGGIISMRVMEKSKVTADYASYEFHIKDTGIGMSKEFVTHIFEPFEREKNSTISGIQGTGLGMAITKNIVDMMNGSIEVRSELGVGTEFIVSFTFRLHSGARKPQNIPELKNCRALVVDDDFNTCDSVSYMLGQIGMRAEWTLSGKEAVLRTRQAVMRGDDYCVYIIDWMLPDMNGVEVTRRIRKETGGNVPVIVLTAYDWADIEEEAKEAGVTAFCSKPLFFSELRSCLYSIVNTDEEEELEQEDTKQPEFRTGRILLAEDNELNQEIAEAILGDAGFEVEIAENGQIAVDMLNKVEPGYYQLVLMDVQMPVMNGYEATREVRSLDNPEIANIPILAMTANAFEEDKQAALRCRMNGHIAKPIDIDNLFGTLRQILK